MDWFVLTDVKTNSSNFLSCVPNNLDALERWKAWQEQLPLRSYSCQAVKCRSAINWTENTKTEIKTKLIQFTTSNAQPFNRKG